MITENENQIKTPTGWWTRCPEHFSKGQKIHNMIELELRIEGIKPISYADRGLGYSVFHFNDKRNKRKGSIIVLEPEYFKQANGPVTVTFKRDGEEDMEYFSNKQYIHFLLS
jgi:hypothetical protein